MSALPIQVAVLDREGNIVATNEAWRAFVRELGAGTASPAGEGGGYRDVWRPGPAVPEAAAIVRGIQAVLDGTEPALALEYAWHPAAGERGLLLSATPLAGVPGGVVVSQLDLTGGRHAEAERAQQRDTDHQAEQLATMGQLLSGVAHELNNPLSVVIGQAALLAQLVGEGPLEERAEKISAAAQRCAGILRTFLSLARQRPPEPRAVRLNQVVQEALELLAYPLRVDDVTVVQDLAPALPVLWADPHQLHQVLVHLITNAHQALRQSPPPRRLSLTTRHDVARDWVSLTVGDSGPGIPAEVQSRIFEPFFTTRAPGQGTGLGLALCQGIIGGHGGVIRVESAPGEGAVFRAELPVHRPPLVEREALAAAVLPAGGRRAILVVDDEVEVAGVLADLLAAEGHHVDTAPNGAVALERLRERSYDLVLSDIRMPELDGPGLYREVERRYPRLARRFVFLTGDPLGPEASELLGRAGAPGVSKPFVPEEVRRVVRQVLGAPSA